MRLILSILSLLPAYSLAQSLPPRDYEVNDYYALHIHPFSSAHDVASHLGLILEGQLGELQHHYLFRTRKRSQDLVGEAMVEHKRRKRKRDLVYHNDLLDAVLLHQKQRLKPPMQKRTVPAPPQPQSRADDGAPHRVPVAQLDNNDRPAEDPAVTRGKEIAAALNINDPIFQEQWHLYNAVQPGHDLNVTDLWMQGVTGKNATVCIVDDGLDMDSDDLKDNYFAEGSYDFNENVAEPKPRLSDDRHGTRCAGEVAAVKNNVCGVGVAWDAKIAGIRILSKAISDADEALAMNYAFQSTDIYSCSWGPPDDGKEMGQPGILIKRAMVNAIQNGRQGRGTIYVFAAGNGAAFDDNCNFDGYTNSIYSITVGAIDRKGLHPYYSEQCSAQLVVTYSSGSGDAIHTTDVGAHECFSGHGGTSAAGPLAAGVYALALQVRPELTWRDMQWLTVLTAVPLDETSDWQNTTLGKRFSHQYGYGKLDAWALVEAAKNFTLVKPQAWLMSPWQHIRQPIPQGDKGLSHTYDVTADQLQQANLERLEHITVTMNVDHTRRGDLSVELRSPSGIVSHLSTSRNRDNDRSGYVDWTFMSVAHWGESGEGSWTVIVKDTVENEHSGTLVDWKLNLFGESVDPSIQGLLPMPNERDDDAHDSEDAVASTASISAPTSTRTPVDNPSGHIDRPINFKPSVTVTSAIAATSTSVTSSAATDSSNTSATPSSTSTTTALTPTESAKYDHYLPSVFPNFGVSPRTQLWIYGSAVLIIIFCVGLSIYFWLARRKQARINPRDDYEFEVLDNVDEDGANGNAGNKMGGRRAGELYDAFAGESDRDVFSDEEPSEDFDRVGRDQEKHGS